MPRPSSEYTHGGLVTPVILRLIPELEGVTPFDEHPQTTILQISESS